MSDFQLQPKGSDAIEKAAESSVPAVGQEEASFLKQLKGFWVTFSTMFKKPLTIEYPEVKPEVQPRFHGRHQLNRYEDGLEKCIGCELCAWACPADAIYVEGENNSEENRMSPGERHAIRTRWAWRAKGSACPRPGGPCREGANRGRTSLRGTTRRCARPCAAAFVRSPCGWRKGRRRPPGHRRICGRSRGHGYRSSFRQFLRGHFRMTEMAPDSGEFEGSIPSF